MDVTTATATSLEPVNIETVPNAMREIEFLQELDQWIVIDPQGRMYKGKVEEVTRVLLAEHPLMKMPKMLPFERGALDV